MFADALASGGSGPEMVVIPAGRFRMGCVTRSGFFRDERPVYHRAGRRIRAHVALSVIALLLERMAEYACGDTWRNIRNDLKRIKLVQLSGPNAPHGR